MNPNVVAFKDYGGRGIKVCERWLKFENFAADMGERPPNCTLERRDNDGDYSPSNCYWATWIQQARNKRNSYRIDIDGKACTLVEACAIRGVPTSTVYTRVSRGWPQSQWFIPTAPGVYRSKR